MAVLTQKAGKKLIQVKQCENEIYSIKENTIVMVFFVSVDRSGNVIRPKQADNRNGL